MYGDYELFFLFYVGKRTGAASPLSSSGLKDLLAFFSYILVFSYVEKKEKNSKGKTDSF